MEILIPLGLALGAIAALAVGGAVSDWKHRHDADDNHAANLRWTERYAAGRRGATGAARKGGGKEAAA